MNFQYTKLLLPLSSSKKGLNENQMRPLLCQWSAIPVELSDQLGAGRYVGQW